jgi:flagellar protein FlaG
MLIQNNSSINPALQPAVRAAQPAPAVPDTPAAATATQPGVAVSPAQLKSAVDTINRALQDSAISLQFSVDQSTHTTVVKMTDTSTGKLVRQFPSEATLAISREIDQLQQGLLLKQQA